MSEWKNNIISVIRYLGGGAANTIVGFTTIFLLMSLGVSPIISNISGYAVGLFLGFVLSKKLVFKSDGKILGEGARYLLAFALSFLANLIVLSFSIYWLQCPEFQSQILASGVYTIIMYILCRWIVFDGRSTNNS